MALRSLDADAVAAIDSIAREEREHHDAALRELGKPTWPLQLLETAVSASTEMVIWLGMRL